MIILIMVMPLIVVSKLPSMSAIYGNANNDKDYLNTMAVWRKSSDTNKGNNSDHKSIMTVMVLVMTCCSTNANSYTTILIYKWVYCKEHNGLISGT